MKCLASCICRKHIGHPQSPEARAAISAGHLGIPKSAEHRAKLSQALMGHASHPQSEAARAAVSAAQKGRPRTAEERAKNGAAHRTHGHSNSRTYNSWRDMHARCRQLSYRSFHNYGGRGVRVCARWWSFENFLADMGERPEGKTLDRIDTDGNYEPLNCRWATPKEQAANRRRKKVVIA